MHNGPIQLIQSIAWLTETHNFKTSFPHTHTNTFTLKTQPSASKRNGMQKFCQRNKLRYSNMLPAIKSAIHLYNRILSYTIKYDENRH